MGRAHLAGWGGTSTLSSDKTRHGHTPGDRSRGVCPGPREQWSQLSLCDHKREEMTSAWCQMCSQGSCQAVRERAELLSFFLPGHKAPQLCPLPCLPFPCLAFTLSPSLSTTIFPSPLHTCTCAYQPPLAAASTLSSPTHSCQPAVVGGGARRMPSLPGQRCSNWHLSDGCSSF